MNEAIKLPGGKRRSAKLVMFSDHLLYIRKVWYTERYKRFYYKDIQSILIQKNQWLIFKLVTLYSILLLFLLLGNEVFLWLAPLVLGPIIILVHLQGRHCHTIISTSVQTEKLLSLNTVKRVNKALKILLPRIESEQGQLDRDVGFTDNPTNSIKNDIIQERGEYQLSSYAGSWHYLFYTFLLIGALASALGCWGLGMPLTMFITVIQLTLTVLFVICLIKQAGSRLTNVAKMTTWLSGIYIFIIYLLGAILAIKAEMNSPGIASQTYKLMKYIASLNPQEDLFIFVSNAIECILAIIFGLLGLILTKKQPFSRRSSTSVNTENPDAQLKSAEE